MNDFKIIKCPSCGSSQVETQSESILKCSHCGSKLASKDTNYRALKSDSSLIKTLLFVVIGLIVVIGAVVIWKNNRPVKPLSAEKLVKNQSGSKQEPKTSNNLINKPISSIPQLNTKAMGVNNDNIKTNTDSSIIPELTIISQVAGETIIGGRYWIVEVKNDSGSQVIRPRVVMSLFDKDKKRIGEHIGWAKLDTLDNGANAVILVLISKPPAVEFTSEMKAMAAQPNNFGSNVVGVKVDDFIVNPDEKNNKKATLVGDVSNPNEFRVDFIRVQAIGRNKQGVAVGIADAFVTNSSLAHKEKSGFNIKATTFITEPAETWSLWASGRKHRDN